MSEQPCSVEVGTYGGEHRCLRGGSHTLRVHGESVPVCWQHFQTVPKRGAWLFLRPYPALSPAEWVVNRAIRQGT